VRPVGGVGTRCRAVSEAKRPAPWRGRKRVADPREAWVHVRCTPAEHAAISAAAAQAGLSAGAYVRTVALGSPGPRAKRRPSVEREALARALGLIGLYGSNLNQIAHIANASGNAPADAVLEKIAGEVQDMRAALRRALGHGD